MPFLLFISWESECHGYNELKLKDYEIVFQFKTSNRFQLQLSFEKVLLDVLYKKKILI